MSYQLSEKVSAKIEALCLLGCEQVNQLIADAKNGKKIASLATLSHNETQQLINELDQIMAVYAGDNTKHNESIK